MRHLIAFLASLMMAAAPLWAECAVPDPTASVAGWSVQNVNGDWFASNPEYPNIQAEMFMNTAERPRVLDWVIPERYEGRIGVLQHYAGSPGTSYLVMLVSNVVIDLKTGAVLGEASFSEDCEAMTWNWFDTAVVVEGSDYGEVVIKLP